jgi:hypothetical protein
MTTTTDQHWLYTIVRPDAKGLRHTVLHNPWLVSLDSESWTAATDGRVQVLVRGAVDGIAPASDHDQKLILNALASTTGDRHPARLAALKDWCGIVPIPADQTCPDCDGTLEVDCEECDGDGETKCDHCGREGECPECDGRKTFPCESCVGGKVSVPPESRPGLLFGRTINRTMLARVLAHLDGKTVVVTAAKDRILIECATPLGDFPVWKVLLMAMTDATTESPIDTFPE